jgi:pyrimidine-specific ribonucleoside hydrolase
VPLEKTTRNALRMLSLIGHTGVPVAPGAASPLRRPLRTAEDIHGESGLEGSELPDPYFERDERHATELIADTLREAPGPVTLIPTGPLTNVATFLREHSELKARIARISLMGGASVSATPHPPRSSTSTLTPRPPARCSSPACR